MKSKNTASALLRRNFRFTIVTALLVLPSAITLLARDPGLTVVAVVLTVVSFFFAVLVGSQFVLPLQLPTLDERINSLLAYTGWLLGLHRASFLVEDVTSKRTVEPGSGMLPGIIVVDGHTAVLTKRFQHYLRVLGPGTHFSLPFERVPVIGDGSTRGKVREVVDLRKQMRFLPLSAQTKDGMTVRTAFIAQFYIDREQDPRLDKHLVYRFYEQAVQKAVMSERIGEKPGEYYDWTTLPAALGSDLLLHIISTYNLDTLYAARDEDDGLTALEIRKKIGEELTAGLRDKLQPYGIHLIFAACGKLTPADERVTRERIETWRATRERMIKIEEAFTQASIERERELTRGQAERDMILRILEGLQAIPPQYYDSLVPMRLVAALEVMFGGGENGKKPEASH
jgi:hypothetical protein